MPRVEPACSGWLGGGADALFVEVGDYARRIGDGAEEAIKFGHNHECLALVRRGEELAAGGTASERLAAADAGVLKDLGQPKSQP